jgi:biopolymer transport protein ExbB
MDAFLSKCWSAAEQFWLQAVKIWSEGGWAMYAIAVVAFVMFALGVHIHLRLRSKARIKVSEETWRRWIDHPTERHGPLGDMLDMVTGGRTVAETAYFFGQLRETESAPFERDLRVMKVCVSAAPLVGLLGTVTGMLETFGVMATGSGGDKTIDMIAGGISEALITTETGLVIALPGLFLQYQLARRFQHYKAFLAHLETVCTQTLHRAQSAAKQRLARAAATAQVAALLRQRLTETRQRKPTQPPAPRRAATPTH